MTFFIAISDRAADGQRLGLRPPQRLDLNQLSRVLCRYEAVVDSFASNGGGGEQDMPAAPPRDGEPFGRVGRYFR
jgi:hypothetical protein